MPRCVLLFARAPRAEARRKGLHGTEGLFALAAKRVAAAAAESGFDLVVVGPAGTEPAVRARRISQRGCGFTERLENAVTDARALGYAQVVVVPGDVPGFGAACLAEAAPALEQGKLVLGPSPDGGVYLLGLGRSTAVPRGVRWRTAAVFRDLLERAGRHVCVLPALADVDRPRDLHRLGREGDLDPVLFRVVRDLRRRALPGGSIEDERPFVRFRPLVEALRGPPSLA
jgi:glycosyltransferase A (GT-A) superfamily protein (DUF2064 family)